MRAVVVAYESMYGNTRGIAEAIADGLRSTCSVTVVPVSRLEREALDKVDLIVIGGPTHVRGMSRASTRKAAVAAASKPGSTLTVQPDAQATGVRELLASLGQLNVQAAVFDTKIKMAALLSGRASLGIAKGLRRHGARMLAKPESFLVTKDNRLCPGEEDRARAWGQQLASALADTTHSSSSLES
jgi:menaquinone-dependent protoporphyrinogen IX oxidase